jgi:hypothetical protein
VDRRKLVSRLLSNRGNLLVIASIGSPTYDVAACGDNPRNFYIWSGLGCTPTVGLGLALAQPGVFRSVVDLQEAINRYLAETNQAPKPFTWTADPDKIIAAVKRGHQVLDSIH